MKVVGSSIYLGVRPPRPASIRLSRRSVASYSPFGLSDPRMFMAGPTTNSFLPRLVKLTEGFEDREAQLIQKAYRMADNAFRGITRRSGHPALEHLVSVAEIIRFKFGLEDAELIAAALLHDVIEDTAVTHQDLIREVGKEAADLVEAETKLSKETSGEARDRESWRKWIAAMVRDVRIAILKLADNLDNMKDQEVFPPQKAREHAIETMGVYARVAEILGMWEVKVELEDLALEWIAYDFYTRDKGAYERAIKRTEPLIASYIDALSAALRSADIEAEVMAQHQPLSAVAEDAYKSQMSIGEMLQTNPLQLDRVLMVVKRERDIRRVIDTFTTPAGLPTYVGVENYLTNPKPNGYQAYHLYNPIEDRGLLLVVILTERMYDRNQHGILYYLRRALRVTGALAQGYNWRSILSKYLKRAYITSEKEMREAISSFTSPIVVYTPLRKGIRLPLGSSALDFAFEVHEEIGLHAAYALMNYGGQQRRVTIFTPLPAGATVQINTSRRKKPSPSWLSHVRMPKAIDAIKRYLRALPEERQRSLGREAMDLYSRPYHTNWRAVSRVSFMPEFIQYFSQKYGLESIRNAEDLVLLIGRGDIDPSIAGDEFNKFYSNKIRERKTAGRLRPFSARIRVEQDRPGLLNELTGEISGLKINIDQGKFSRNPDGSANINLVVSVASSLQIVQVKNIVHKFLKKVGGGRIEKSRLWKRGERGELL